MAKQISDLTIKEALLKNRDISKNDDEDKKNKILRLLANVLSSDS